MKKSAFGQEEGSPALVIHRGSKQVKHELSQKRDFLIGRGKACDLILDGAGVSRRHARLKVDNGRYILHDLKSTNGTFVNGERIGSRELNHGDEIEISRFSIVFDSGRGLEPRTAVTVLERRKGETALLDKQFRRIVREMGDEEAEESLRKYHQMVRESRKRLSALAKTDRLTKLYNRSFFDIQLSEEVERARRHNRGLSLILADIDHFKSCNDTYGHQKGDEVLSGIAELISSNSRMGDTAARYGGEEIAVILPETTREDATLLAERFRQIVSERSTAIFGVNVTISVGVAIFPENAEDEATLVKAADKALYQAKSEGRNRVVRFEGKI